MSQAKWIWYNGDFEIYHSMKLHTRREEFGCEYPPMWALSAPYPNVSFWKDFHAEGTFTFRVVTPHKAYAMSTTAATPSMRTLRSTRATTPSA